MDITVLCTDPHHPVVGSLHAWAEKMRAANHSVTFMQNKSQLTGGDLLFLVSCSQILRDDDRRKYRKVLVLHASDLPEGRGWSPHVWTILAGKNRITVSLLEAVDPVDSGPIWLKHTFELEGHELLPEINAKLFASELMLMTQAVDMYGSERPVPQSADVRPQLPRRTSADSCLDPHKTIAEQFELLRVVDNLRYPAHFYYRGKRYRLSIEKDTHDDQI